jgi:hypothetical protein
LLNYIKISVEAVFEFANLFCLHKQKFEKLGVERNWSFAQHFLGARRMAQKRWAQSANFKKNIL